ncbi:MAG: hypothetical protein AcusKO_28780 [Acuticoccus sp.]
MLFASVTDLSASGDACVVVGSHGGLATGALAASRGVRGLICHDAGIGLGGAGVAARGYLDDLGGAAAAVSHRSARIGDAQDMWRRGTISTVNRTAARLGIAIGQTVQDAFARIEKAAPITAAPSGDAPAFQRAEANEDGVPFLLCDSASQIAPGDRGRIVVTGSHGALPGEDPRRAAKADVAFVLFNDAGVGIDAAGISRLPALDRRGIAAACVDAMTARIGEASSTHATGIISRVNDTAARCALAPGMSVRAAIQTLFATTPEDLAE